MQIYPYAAGVRGGLVGGAAMAVLAILYGLIGHGSIWYPVNLLAAAGSANISAMSYDQLRAFSATGLVLAIIIHGFGSALVACCTVSRCPCFRAVRCCWGDSGSALLVGDSIRRNGYH